MENIGRFELRRVLGRGSVATVYEARDPAHGERVALKVVTAGLHPPKPRRLRFLSEAQRASDLAHPNLVHVVETGEHLGRPYVAMELVEGVDLLRVIRSGRPFPVEFTLDVLRQVCEGLHAAHSAGLVHADLKPTDVRVTPEGMVKILDFGIAALKSEERGEGPSAGGVHYRAPEVIEGKKPSPRSDVFSVGAVFYEMLAARKPFPADTVTGVMFRIRHEDPAPLPPSDFSPGLESLVLRALRRDPGERHASLEEMRARLVEAVKEAAPRLAARQSGAPLSTEAPAGEAGLAPDAPPDSTALHAALLRAREQGSSGLALAIVRRLLDLDPDDTRARKVADQIDAEGREAEAEQLCAIALAYSADGEVEKAAEIAEKIERLSPWSPRYLQLQVYLDEEAARRSSEGLVAEARRRLQGGDFQEAARKAEEALSLYPLDRAAQDLREQARSLRGGASAPASEETAASDVELARHLEQALGGEVEAAPRAADVEMLASAALDRFLKNDHAGAQRAASMALRLDPGHRRARELLRVLGAVQ